jgi:Tfp pilus assembly protein PilO
VSLRRILAPIGLLLAGMAWPVVVNQVAVRRQLDRRADAAEQALEEARTVRAEIEIARRAKTQFATEAQSLERELALLHRLLPERADRDAALAELRAAAGARGVELLSSRQEAPRDGKAWREVPLEVTLEGPTDGLLALAEQMQDRLARTAVSRLHLRPIGHPGTARLDLEIVLFELPDT